MKGAGTRSSGSSLLPAGEQVREISQSEEDRLFALKGRWQHYLISLWRRAGWVTPRQPTLLKLVLSWTLHCCPYLVLQALVIMDSHVSHCLESASLHPMKLDHKEPSQTGALSSNDYLMRLWGLTQSVWKSYILTLNNFWMRGKTYVCILPVMSLMWFSSEKSSLKPSTTH